MSEQTSSPSTVRWHRRKDARPAEIIEAALDLFVANGFKGTRLDEVARKAGVSKGTVYLYFESKEALFRAVISQIIVPELVKAEQFVESYTGSQAELLVILMTKWWNVIGKTRLAGIPKLMIAEAANFPELAQFYLTEVIYRARRLIQSSLKTGMQTGEFTACDIPTAVRVLTSPLIFAAIWQKSLAPFDAEQYDEDAFVKMHLEFFLNSIKTDAGHEAG